MRLEAIDFCARINKFKIDSRELGPSGRVFDSEEPMLLRLVNWLTLRDYEREKQDAFRGVASRFTRGNIAIQEGRFLAPEDLEVLGLAGDVAANNLRLQTNP